MWSCLFSLFIIEKKNSVQVLNGTSYKLHDFIMLQALSYTAQGTNIKKHCSKIEYKLNSAQRFIYNFYEDWVQKHIVKASIIVPNLMQNHTLQVYEFAAQDSDALLILPTVILS